VAAGVGGTLDFLAGYLKRAPLWMQRSGVEWLYRLAQEPRRLFRRYLKDLWVFGWSILAQWWQLQLRLSKTHQAIGEGSIREDETWFWLRLPGRFDLATSRQLAPILECAATDLRPCLLDLTDTQSIDSTGVALLIMLQKKVCASGRQLVLLAPRPSLLSALHSMRLDNFFDSAPNIASAQHLLEVRSRERAATVSLRTAAAISPLVWSGEITAANADEVWERTHAHMALFSAGSVNTRSTALTCDSEQAGSPHAISNSKSPNGQRRELAVDLSAVRFIDSTGLGVMIRTRKAAGRFGIHLKFDGLQPSVRNVLQLARLEEFLLSEKVERA